VSFNVRYEEASLLTGRPWLSDALNSTMRTALLALVRHSKSSSSAATLGALRRRGLLDTAGGPTELGMTVAMLSMPLREQCERIGLLFEDLQTAATKTPELYALTLAQKDGWNGAACEGGTMLTLLKAASFPALVRFAKAKSHNANAAEVLAASQYLEAQLVRENVEVAADAISCATPEAIREAFEIIYNGYIVNQYFGLTADLLVQLFESLGSAILCRLIVALGKDPYRYRKGWPDLTLVRGSEVRFVEVKTTDRLHASQLITIPYFASIMGRERFSILQLRASKKLSQEIAVSAEWPNKSVES
jgi:hypothetical protein